MRDVDNVTVYKFVKKLSTPFNKWRAYKHGIIDGNGNIIKDKKEFSSRNEKDSFTKLDLLALNIKKAFSKMPNGDSRLYSYAAALYLIKEHSGVFDNEMLTEEAIDDILSNINENNEYFQLIEDAPTNNVSSGAIAGVKTDSYSPPGLHHHVMKRHKTKTNKTKETLKDGSK